MKDATHRYGRVVVFGGGSEIAHATLLELAREGGYTAVLAARHPEELDVGELERAGITVERVPFDALQLGSHADAVAEAFGSRDVDLVVVAFGVLGEQAHDERDAEAAVAVAATNYVYGSSKAGLDAFADGLALTLDDTGVRLVIVRPGFVRTKMTAGLRPMPLSVGATEVGAAIAGALRSERSVIWVPALLRVVMALIRLAPRAVVQRL
jgi:decaprenylphospho-beta-D-erythro-pentofuranosid-2-ulose 2-reductase